MIRAGSVFRDFAEISALKSVKRNKNQPSDNTITRLARLSRSRQNWAILAHVVRSQHYKYMFLQQTNTSLLLLED